jgi:hypothetical protein
VKQPEKSGSRDPVVPVGDDEKVELPVAARLILDVPAAAVTPARANNAVAELDVVQQSERGPAGR